MGFSKTLFELVGGAEKLNTMVDDFTSRVKANPKLGSLYPADMTPLKSAYTEFAMELLDGPKLFSKHVNSSSLVSVHEDIPITKERADEMLNCADETMRHFRLPQAVQQSARKRLQEQVYRMINS